MKWNVVESQDLSPASQKSTASLEPRLSYAICLTCCMHDGHECRALVKSWHGKIFAAWYGLLSHPGVSANRNKYTVGWMTKVQFLAMSRDISLNCHIQIGFGTTHPIQWVLWALSSEVKAATLLHQVSRSRTSGAVPPFLHMFFWCLICIKPAFSFPCTKDIQRPQPFTAVWIFLVDVTRPVPQCLLIWHYLCPLLHWGILCSTGGTRTALW